MTMGNRSGNDLFSSEHFPLGFLLKILPLVVGTPNKHKTNSKIISPHFMYNRPLNGSYLFCRLLPLITTKDNNSFRQLLGTVLSYVALSACNDRRSRNQRAIRWRAAWGSAARSVPGSAPRCREKGLAACCAWTEPEPARWERKTHIPLWCRQG